MYKHNARQMNFVDEQPELFGNLPLNPDNRWVKLARLIPWSRVEEEYRKNFKSTRGQDPLPSRLALGILIVKEKLALSDRDTVAVLRENPYIQHFVGYSEYNYDVKLDPSMLTHFRKRFPADVIAKTNEWIVNSMLCPDDDEDKEDDGGVGGSGGEDDSEASGSTNEGTLILDATCAPQYIQYPTDVRLLSEARQKLEAMQDVLQAGRTEAKPRNYRKKAQREYNRFCRNRRPTKKLIRQALRKQLQYVARDLRLVEEMRRDSIIKLSCKEEELLATIKKLYDQQKRMYDERSHHCEDRIVSLSQPHVRPIVRGKAKAGTEFGAKLTASVVGGYSTVERLSWDAYNESEDLIPVVEAYKNRHGHYPERVLVDQIFRTRKNRAYCKERGIRMNGRPLGRPPKDPVLLSEQKRLECEEAGERNAIEGKFGEGKRRYGLGRVTTRLK
ncbi:MAG TPA: IS5 family transposase, partial [Oscillospiraceae bacterium]|nr:IS5 family transposase [Oscillospiraceae bacterium]